MFVGGGAPCEASGGLRLFAGPELTLACLRWAPKMCGAFRLAGRLEGLQEGSQPAGKPAHPPTLFTAGFSQEDPDGGFPSPD